MVALNLAAEQAGVEYHESPVQQHAKIQENVWRMMALESESHQPTWLTSYVVRALYTAGGGLEKTIFTISRMTLLIILLVFGTFFGI